MSYCSNLVCANFASTAACSSCHREWCQTCAASHPCDGPQEHKLATSCAQQAPPEARKSIFITGANKGIGWAITTHVLERHRDAFVFLGCRDPVRGKALVEKSGWGDRISVVAIDVTDDNSIQRATQQVARELGSQKLFALVNNAGVAHGDPMQTLGVNTFGLRSVSLAFAPLLGDGGRIVNLSSCNSTCFLATKGKGLAPVLANPAVTWDEIVKVIQTTLDENKINLNDIPWALAYGLSKACTNALTVLLARENPRLIINAVHPGFTLTDMTWGFFPGGEGKSAAELGLQEPNQATKGVMHLLFDEVPSGRFFDQEGRPRNLDEICCTCCE